MAVRLARLGRPVKEMIGGVTRWLDEGFAARKWIGTGMFARLRTWRDRLECFARWFKMEL